MENHEAITAAKAIGLRTASAAIWLIKVAVVISPIIGAFYAVGGFARLS